MKKRFLAILLALVMVMALTVPALAESVTVGDVERNYAATTFSDVVSQETVKGELWSMDGDRNAIPLITVKVGTTITVEHSMYGSDNGRDFNEATVEEDGSYACDFQGKKFNTGVADGTPYTLTVDNIGLWYFTGGDGGKDYYLKVIAGDGTTPTEPAKPTEPTEPSKPTEPEKPTEPSKPTEPEKPTELAKPTEPEKPTEPSKPTEPEKPTEPAKPAAGTYTAKKWDTWGQLALNNYGSFAAWPQLYAANGRKGLVPGMTVTLPEKLGSFTRLAEQVLAEGEKLYTVKAGDTLGQIAVNEYGSFMMYKSIFERNSDRLKNVNMIYEGQTLVLPVKPAK